MQPDGIAEQMAPPASSTYPGWQLGFSGGGQTAFPNARSAFGTGTQPPAAEPLAVQRWQNPQRSFSTSDPEASHQAGKKKTEAHQAGPQVKVAYFESLATQPRASCTEESFLGCTSVTTGHGRICRLGPEFFFVPACMTVQRLLAGANSAAPLAERAALSGEARPTRSTG